MWLTVKLRAEAGSFARSDERLLLFECGLGVDILRAGWGLKRGRLGTPCLAQETDVCESTSKVLRSDPVQVGVDDRPDQKEKKAENPDDAAVGVGLNPVECANGKAEGGEG